MAMANSGGAGTHRVDVYQAMGNDGHDRLYFNMVTWCFIAENTLLPSQMESALAPYLTVKEYQDTINKCNKVLKREGARTSWCFGLACCSMFWICIASGVLFGAVVERTPKMNCVAHNGECPYNVIDSSSGACCRWHCCSEGTDPPSGQCTLINKTSDVTCDCVTHHSQNTNKASSTSCRKTVKIEGETDINEDWVWAAAGGGTLLAIGGSCLVGAMLFPIFQFRWGLAREMAPHFVAWRNKGLGVTYSARQARITIHLPAAPTIPMGQSAAVVGKETRTEIVV
jgi:hypothetical protein